ncbi:hypothetical protein [Stenotrophomonas rhizophila]|uniref:hypothetical protein n=1 Tax=Stenotrophomonas rhizophila TaxID=216778 RepID=UPI0011A400C6|nr:hypothetical protein [Stenotrophomonas rhizophila]
MAATVISISAIGTRGSAAGKLFMARPDASGRYVLNRKRPSSSGAPTNRAVNKVYAVTLDQAVDLLSTNDYLVNLVSEDGTRALREFKRVQIKRAAPTSV